LRRIAPIAAVFAMILTGGFTRAQSPNYDIAEVGWRNLNPDGADSRDGWFLGGGFELNKRARFHFFGDIGELSDSRTWSVGGGLHGLLGKRADLVAQVAWVDLGEEDGPEISLGLRWMVLRRLELNGFLNYVNLDFGNAVSGEVNGIWDLARRWGVGGGWRQGDDGGEVRAFVRFNFGSRGEDKSGASANAP